MYSFTYMLLEMLNKKRISEKNKDIKHVDPIPKK